MIDKSYLDNLIIGRVEPHIYAFTTNSIPNYLKVGDTYRAVAQRLNEWRVYFPNLKQQYVHTAKIADGVYFRDFAVHQFLEKDKKKSRLKSTDLAQGLYYSKEFFGDTKVKDVKDAIDDIYANYQAKKNKYQYYNAESRLPENYTYVRNKDFEPRPNQLKTIQAFHQARENGHKNLLMYAVMRFGKTFTAMCCALDMNAKFVVVVSGKADVLSEWKEIVESHVYFKDYDFLTSKDLADDKIITKKLKANKRVVVFLTLQDLQGTAIKTKHREIFSNKIDLLLVDETHFGARAEKYGAIFEAKNYQPDIKHDFEDDDFVDIEEADKQIKVIKADTTIHLSGTPYRILMSSEFKKEDIIAFYQFSDIIEDKEAWDKENVLNDEYKEWDNPYYGFPQMVRFAFHPSEKVRRRLEQLRSNGTTYAFSSLLKPMSIVKDPEGLHKKFMYENEVLDLFEVIDGSKADKNVLEFLNYDKIKEGNMCRHIVVVLPYCASCDALEALIKNNRGKFRNLQEYEIINITGVENPNAYKSTEDIKRTIEEFESKGKKTITLTDKRMMTGSTVPEWDTMIYLKDTVSPQEYDQAIFRLQNQYVKTCVNDEGDSIKVNMKPQTLLVDFDPNRMFTMQEIKSKIYNANVDTRGNAELEKRIVKELSISPIVTINSNKIVEVKAVDIMNVVRNYQKDRGISEEALDAPVDLNILNDPTIYARIELENELGTKVGLSTAVYKSENEEGYDMDIPEVPEIGIHNDHEEAQTKTSEEKNPEISLKKKIQSYYSRILLFAYLSKDKIISITDIVNKIDNGDNKRIAANLGLSKDVLQLLVQKMNKFVLSDLDYKVQNLNELSHASDLTPEQRASVAMNKFGKLGDAVVITPNKICDYMIGQITDKYIREIVKHGGRILDVAGTAGEFAMAIYKKATSLKIKDGQIKNLIYTIPKSPICYELTRKLYEMLGLNIENISTFYATDLLDGNKNKIDYSKAKSLLMQNKPFAQIKLTDKIEGEENMITFDAIVGNPPYQISKGTKNFDIWPGFVELADMGEVAVFVHPGRWVVPKKNMEKTREMMLNSGLESFNYYPDGTQLFSGVSIDGGVTITRFIKGYSGEIRYYNNDVYYGVYSTDKVFISNIYENEIYNKLNPNNFGGKTMAMRMFGNPGSLAGQEFGYKKSDNLSDLKPTAKGMKKPIKIWANANFGKGTRFSWHYIEYEKLSDPPQELFSSRKIMIDKKGHAISSGKLNNIMNNIPQIVDKNVIASGDVLFFLPEIDDDYNLNLIKSYFMTKTIRFLMSIKQKDLYVRGFEILPDYTYFIARLNGGLFSDEFFYREFNFSQELKDHIESVVSEKVE